jgi:MFS family permease
MTMLSVGFVAAAAVADPERGYALGGAAAGAYAVATALVGPIIGRLADRRGQLPLARILAIVATGAAILAVASLSIPGAAPLLVPLAFLVGATQPNIGAFTRARWAALQERIGTIDSAQALESINDELAFLVGPPIVALLATTGFPGLPILFAMGLMIVGAFGITSRWSLPTPRPHPDAGGTGWRPEFPAGLGILLSVGALGGALGAVQVLQLAYSDALGMPDGAALVYFVNSGASLIGAIVVGGRTWTMPARRRFTLAMLVYAVGVIPSVVVTGYIPFVLASILSGLAIAATFIQSNALVAEVTPARSRTSSFAVLVSATAFGIAIGAALAGSAITTWGADIARMVLLPLAFLAALTAVVTDLRSTGRDRALDAAPPTT